MILKIRKLNKDLVGQIMIDGILISFDPSFSTTDRVAIEKICSSTIPLLKEEYDSEKREFKMVKKEIGIKQPLFSLALRDYLSKRYLVEELHPETDKKILDIISQLPSDDSLRIEVENKLSNLNNLEKTFLLRELQKATFMLTPISL